MIQVPSAPNVAVVVGDFPHFSPESLFDAFVNPNRLVQWWPEEVDLDVKVGGQYTLMWRKQGWNLFGIYTSLNVGHHLGFTWNWEHEPHVATQQVDLWFMPIAKGTRLSVFHSPMLDDEMRQSIIEGWLHFLGRLDGLVQDAEPID